MKLFFDHHIVSEDFHAGLGKNISKLYILFVIPVMASNQNN